MTAIGGIVGGLGLFIFGMWLLTENLKTLAGRELRRSVHRWTGNPATALLWGALAGAATQSMSALTFVVIRRSGSTPRRPPASWCSTSSGRSPTSSGG